MAEFEELRLTVNLVDNASTGLAKIRTELVNLTQTAGQMTTSFTQATASATALGSAAVTAGPRLRTISTELSALSRHAADTGRSLAQMGSAAQQGLGGLPRMAMGLWSAADAVKGLGEQMKNIPGVSQAAVVSLGRMAIGVAAIGLVAVAYGISVFKFAKEMDQLGRTARTLGMSFAELKYAQDQAKAFGHSAESITRSFQGIQAAQFDLYKNNSELRRKLIAQGVDANWVNQLAAAEPAKAREMIARYGKALEKQAIEAGWGRSAAAALKNQFYGDLGQRPEDMELVLKPVSPERAAEMEKVRKQAENVSKIWGEISLKLKGITFGALSAGLPVLLGALRLADDLFTGIGAAVTFIDQGLAALGTNLLEVLKGVPLLGPVITVIQGLAKLGGVGGDATAPPDVPGVTTPATPQSYTPSGERNPLLQPASFTTDELVDETGENTEQTVKLTSQLDRLNNYFERMEDRSTGSQGGGVQKASYSPSGGGSGVGGSQGTGSGAGAPTGGSDGGAAPAPPQTGPGPNPSGSTTAPPSGATEAPSSSGGTTQGGGTAAPSGGGTATPSGGSAAPSAAPSGGGAASAPSGDQLTMPFGGDMKDRLAGLKGIMGEVQEAGMTTTSGYRDPGHRLSRANRGSSHIKGLAFDTRARTAAQVDAAMAKQREIFAAHGMVEGRDYKFKDEVRRPSGHATGKHLHTQLTPDGMRRYAQSKAAKESQVAGVNTTGLIQDGPPIRAAREGEAWVPEAAPWTPGDLDRGALDRKALSSDAASVRADGTVKVDVGGSTKPKGSSRAKLFHNTPLEKSEAGQNTQHGPKVYDTADNYLHQNI